MPFCPHCGAQVGDNETFCRSCGKPITPSSATASNPGYNVQQPPPAWQYNQNTPPSQVMYCQECGSIVPNGVMYCPNCGSTRFAPVPPARLERPAGVTILGIVQIIFSIIDLMIGVVLGGAFLTSAGFAGASGLGGIFAAIGVIFIVAGALSFIFAIAFFTGRNWGRILMMIGAVLELFAIPVGTIIGIIVLWYLTRPRVRAYFKQPKGRIAMRNA